MGKILVKFFVCFVIFLVVFSFFGANLGDEKEAVVSSLVVSGLVFGVWSGIEYTDKKRDELYEKEIASVQSDKPLHTPPDKPFSLDARFGDVADKKLNLLVEHSTGAKEPHEQNEDLSNERTSGQLVGFELAEDNLEPVFNSDGARCANARPSHPSLRKLF